jgi:hypothetical protein
MSFDMVGTHLAWVPSNEHDVIVGRDIFFGIPVGHHFPHNMIKVLMK